MINILIPIAFCLGVTIMILTVVDAKSEDKSNKYVADDVEIIKARLIVSDFDKRLKAVEQKLPTCKNDRQCIYNVYTFNGFAYTDLTTTDNNVVVLRSSVMTDIKKTRDTATSPLTIELGVSK